MRVVAFDRPRLREVERLALRHALHHVYQHDVAELFLGRDCATVAPTLPAPTTVIFGRAAIELSFPGVGVAVRLAGVERRPGLEPRDLLAGHRVPDRDLFLRPSGLRIRRSRACPAPAREPDETCGRAPRCDRSPRDRERQRAAGPAS